MPRLDEITTSLDLSKSTSPTQPQTLSDLTQSLNLGAPDAAPPTDLSTLTSNLNTSWLDKTADFVSDQLDPLNVAMLAASIGGWEVGGGLAVKAGFTGLKSIGTTTLGSDLLAPSTLGRVVHRAAQGLGGALPLAVASGIKEPKGDQTRIGNFGRELLALEAFDMLAFIPLGGLVNRAIGKNYAREATGASVTAAYNAARGAGMDEVVARAAAFGSVLEAKIKQTEKAFGPEAARTVLDAAEKLASAPVDDLKAAISASSDMLRANPQVRESLLREGLPDSALDDTLAILHSQADETRATANREAQRLADAQGFQSAEQIAAAREGRLTEHLAAANQRLTPSMRALREDAARLASASEADRREAIVAANPDWSASQVEAFRVKGEESFAAANQRLTPSMRSIREDNARGAAASLANARERVIAENPDWSASQIAAYRAKGEAAFPSLAARMPKPSAYAPSGELSSAERAAVDAQAQFDAAQRALGVEPGSGKPTPRQQLGTLAGREPVPAALTSPEHEEFARYESEAAARSITRDVHPTVREVIDREKERLDGIITGQKYGVIGEAEPPNPRFRRILEALRLAPRAEPATSKVASIPARAAAEAGLVAPRAESGTTIYLVSRPGTFLSDMTTSASEAQNAVLSGGRIVRTITDPGLFDAVNRAEALAREDGLRNLQEVIDFSPRAVAENNRFYEEFLRRRGAEVPEGTPFDMEDAAERHASLVLDDHIANLSAPPETVGGLQDASLHVSAAPDGYEGVVVGTNVEGQPRVAVVDPLAAARDRLLTPPEQVAQRSLLERADATAQARPQPKGKCPGEAL